MNLNNLMDRLKTTTDRATTSGGINGGSLAAGAALGGIAGFLANSPTGRRLGRKAMRHGRTAAGVGGLALIGGVAFKALSALKTTSETTPAEEPTANPDIDTDPLLILRSMIAAAHADGELDAVETDRIVGRMQDSELSGAERRLIFTELENPVTPAQLRQGCRSLTDRTAVYAAATMAIDVDCAAESAYLEELAADLALAPELVSAISRELQS